MKSIKNFFRYIMAFNVIFIMLLAANLLFFLIIGTCTKSDSAYVRAGWFADQLSRNISSDEGGSSFTMSDEGMDKIDSTGGFAMLIDEDGKVCWEYKMPKELPREYSRKDIASFTRWYLHDYPVHTWITDDGIFVFGKPKGTEWIFTLRYATNTLNAYFTFGPFVLIADAILLIAFPVFIVRKQSRRRERERTEWIAGVSHDIRTPLSIVLGTAAALREEDSDELTVKKAELIEAQALKMRTLISNLNTENKLQFGLGSWDKEKFNTAALIREIMCDIVNRRQDEGYSFDACIAENTEGVTVCADRELVRRLFENLINNAVKHNPEGCNVTVTMKKAHFPYRCEIIVEDDGRGVDSKMLRQMNRPVEMKAKELPEHGLGLRLVKHIAGLYHWRVRFRKGKEGGLQCLVLIA